MWLLNAKTLQLEDASDESRRPPYAILSHRWRAAEVSFVELAERRELRERVEQKFGFLKLADRREKLGYTKIRNCCDVVRSHFNLDYVWIDTCCIDKRNSADLSEAINSMYTWYERSAVCVVYLDDVEVPESESFDSHDWVTALSDSEWLKRGWTLQELVASKSRSFYGIGQKWAHAIQT